MAPPPASAPAPVSGPADGDVDMPDEPPSQATPLQPAPSSTTKYMPSFPPPPPRTKCSILCAQTAAPVTPPHAPAKSYAAAAKRGNSVTLDHVAQSFPHLKPDQIKYIYQNVLVASAPSWKLCFTTGGPSCCQILLSVDCKTLPAVDFPSLIKTANEALFKAKSAL